VTTDITGRDRWIIAKALAMAIIIAHAAQPIPDFNLRLRGSTDD
jgi:hypothetical protein